jgi:hypothetical protein
MFNQIEKYVLVTRPREAERELTQIAHIRAAEECREKVNWFRRLAELTGWSKPRPVVRISSQCQECACGY